MSLIRKAFKRLHYPVDVIAQCVRWYLAYALSLRDLEEIMAERGILVDHSILDGRPGLPSPQSMKVSQVEIAAIDPDFDRGYCLYP